MQNGVLAAAIAGELIFLIGHPLFGWGPHRRRFVETPPALTLTQPAPPSGRSVLLRLAAAAGRQPAPAVHRYGYVHTQTWVWTRQQATPRPDYARYQLVTTWANARGLGRILTVERTAHGLRTDPVSPLLGFPPNPLTSPAGLARFLGPHVRSPAFLQLATLAALTARQPIAPADEAEALRRLAPDPAIVNAGTTTDRSGRAGVAVTATGGARRITLVFDPDTGRLLESDNQLQAGSDAIDVPAGGLLSYRVWLNTGWVSRIGQVPPPAGG
jgi:hypothetical protein